MFKTMDIKLQHDLNRVTKWERQELPYASKAHAGIILSASDVAAWHCFAQGGELSSRVEEAKARRQHPYSVLFLCRTHEFCRSDRRF